MMLLRTGEITEVSNCYKCAVDADADADERRRTRENQMVEIRRHKRGLNHHEEDCQGLESSSHDTYVSKQLEGLSSMVGGVMSNDNNLQLEATTQIRKLLSVERNPPIEEVIQSGVVPQFVEFLSREDFPLLQFEAAWALTNIAYGSSKSTKVVIDHGALPIFVKLLGSSNDDVREQAVCALGVIAGESPTCRDLILGNGALVPLLEQLKEDAKLSMMRNATWTLSNFCRGKPQPSFKQVRPTLKTLQRLLHYDDEEVLTDSCWALSYLSYGYDKIDEVTESGISPRLVELLIHPSPSVLIPALETITNIVMFGNEAQFQVILELGALGYLLRLLTDNPNKSVKEEACFAVANITDGNEDKIQAVIDAHFIEPLIELLQTAEFDTKVYAARAISNAASGGSCEQIEYLVSKGCIKALCDLLLSPYPGVVTACLDGLAYILTRGKVRHHVPLIEEAGFLERIENLACHKNSKISENACDLLTILETDVDMDFSLEEISENTCPLLKEIAKEIDSGESGEDDSPSPSPSPYNSD